MLKKLFNRRIFSSFFLIFFFASTVLLAQGEGSGQDKSSLNLNLSNSYGGLYYQDVAGLQLAMQGVPFEGSIDEATYILGSNDLITIEIQGVQKNIFRSIIINSSGEVIIPSVGTISLNNQTISKAEETIRKIAGSVYKNPEVKISLELPKPTTVHISGSIPFPGKYLIPAQSRTDLAIYRAVIKLEVLPVETSNFLPSYTSQILDESDYSYRNILIEHIDGTTSSADLIRYFRTGDLSSNPIIKDGDRIFLRRTSRQTPRVSISGAVSYGYDLEYRVGDTPETLLSISSGFEGDADQSKVFVYRRSGSTVDKITVDSAEWSNFLLEPNDRVVAPYNNEISLTSSAWVNGEVALPGNYPILNGTTTVYELLELSGGFTKVALPSAAYLVRANGLKNEIPNKFNSQLMMRTSDQTVQGLQYLDSETNLSRNRVSINLMDEDELKNLPLFAGDQLYIPRDEQTVFVFGQVNNPGYFPFSPSKKSINDYIMRAGGYALSADKKRIFVIKAGSGTWFKPNDTNLESGDKIFIDRLPVEDLNALRSYEIQKAQLKNQRTQLIMTGITTITGIITTYVAIRRL